MNEAITTEFISQAIDEADLNALRIALLQATGDQELAEVEIVMKPIRGGAFFLHSLTEEGERLVKERALAFLSDPANRGPVDVVPSDDEIRRLTQALTGDPVSDRMLDLAREELAFEDFPRESQWTNGAPTQKLANFHVIVVGAGASGIASGVKMKRLGINFTIIERLDDITGTWHRNQYPDVRVDTNCFLYQFKFEKRYKWPEYFPSQPRVKEYLHGIAEKYDIKPHVRLGEEVVSAVWDDDEAQWSITTQVADGRTRDYRANVVISASGVFSTPLVPKLPGLETFAGPVVHTADWDQDIDYSGRRVGLIGNGSTGTQLLPRLAEEADHVTAFQRTPQWIINSPLLRTPISANVQWLLDAMPHYWNWASYVQFVGTAETQVAQYLDPEWTAQGGIINERNDKLRQGLIEYVESKIGHRPDLMEKSIPDYAPLARRIVIDNGWFDALLRDDVTLETTGIDHLEHEGIRLTDGRLVELDALILATGFEVSNYFFPVVYEGRNGVTFAEQWGKDGARAHLGITMPNFPNFYALYGPNVTPRFGGFLQWVDVWTRYILDLLIAQIEGDFSSIEVKQEVHDDYNERMDEATTLLLWEQEGQGGYFTNEFGRSGLQMPWEADLYHSWVKKPNHDDFTWTPNTKVES